MIERPACWTDGEATRRAPGFIEDGRACMAWQTHRRVEDIFLVSDCRGCSRLIMAQVLGLAPSPMTLVHLLPKE